MFDCSSHTANSEFVVVTHGGIITDFMMNVFTNQQLNHLCPNFKTVQSLFIPECSITVIRYDEGNYYIDDFAFTTHLTDASMNWHVRNRKLILLQILFYENRGDFNSEKC